MKPKILLYSLVGLVVFYLLIYYNYYQAQQAIKNTRPSPLSVELVSYPESLSVGSSGTFIWHVQSSPDLSTFYSTLYWGNQSSPSALTKNDSPQAVGYPSFVADYTDGRYRLPNDFDIKIKFNKIGKVYFRAYAKVGQEHLWSEENSLEVIK
mgnify:CR=1 FL=1